ncbi:MAG: hypothetical protein ATN35_01955 [Epulopiscium sp. Nele67-Bin004]|nr:MAG: hypothetical protein ATN35_01955 [Epulopiscium sp. Nele67-Bin004]
MELEQSVTIEFEKAKKTDAITMLFNDGKKKHYALSKYDPKKIDSKIFGEDMGNAETIWVFMGLSLGYQIEYLLDYAKRDLNIIIIEPSKKYVELQKEQNPNLEAILAKPSVALVTMENFIELKSVITQKVRAKDRNNVRFVDNSLYLKFFEGFYKVATKEVSNSINFLNINYNTRDVYFIKTLKNIMLNKEATINSYSFKPHWGAYKDIPALIVSGGPSLDKNIEFIKNFKGFVFTGVRTYNKVYDYGGEVDFLCSVDPTVKSFELLADREKTHAAMITLPVSSPDIIANNDGPKYITVNDAPVIYSLFKQTYAYLPAFGSVATLCLSGAKVLGCNPIIFIGQDLAYTDNKTHADTVGAKTLNINEETHRIMVDGYYGGKVPSHNDLEGFLRWIEDYIRDNSEDTTYINATEGGAKIKGTIQMPFEEVVQKYTNQKPKLEHTLKVTDAYEEGETPEEPEKALQDCIQEIKDIKKMIQEGIKYTDEIIAEYKKGPKAAQVKLQKLIRKVDKRVGSNIPTKNALANEAIKIAYSKINIHTPYKQPLHETAEERQIRLASMTNHTYQLIIVQLDRVLELIELKEEDQESEEN